LIGSTRSGKTNYLLSLIQDRQDEAFAFIDKHGEAARQIADAMPCIYWKPADLSHIISLNPLQNVKRMIGGNGRRRLFLSSAIFGSWGRRLLGSCII
jgi:hypothetical protein